MHSANLSVALTRLLFENSYMYTQKIRTCKQGGSRVSARRVPSCETIFTEILGTEVARARNPRAQACGVRSPSQSAHVVSLTRARPPEFAGARRPDSSIGAGDGACDTAPREERLVDIGEIRRSGAHFAQKQHLAVSVGSADNSSFKVLYFE